VHLEAGMRHQPALDGRRLVGRGVSHDQVHVQFPGHGLVDAGQELLELDRAVPRGHLGNHLAACHLQRRVQVGGAMAGVVVAAAPGDPSQQWQDRRGAVQRLDARLLVRAQHHRRIRRVQVQPDHVADLVDELRVGRQLPRLVQVGREPKRPPDPRDRRLAHASRPGHAARRPGRGVGRGLLQGLGDHLLHLGVGDRAGRARPWLVHQPFQPAGGEPPAPLADPGRVHAQPRAGLQVGQALGTGQHDPTAQRQCLAAAAASGPALQRLALLIGQRDLDRGPPPAARGLWLLAHRRSRLPP
jgi:hypothetical protein